MPCLPHPPRPRLRAAPLLAALLVAALFPRIGEATPRVVASIKPVHSLVAGVMAGVGGPGAAPRLLVPGGGSPHGAALRPSAARDLSEADVVFWVGPRMERFLAGALEALAADAHTVALARVPGVRGAGADPHVWLDPRNAEAMVRAIAATLGEVDEANAAAYRAGAAALVRRLGRLDAEIAGLLAPVAGRPFIVYHDAYRAFARRYGLRLAGAVTTGPEHPPGARRLREIRRQIREGAVACVFAEPQFRPGLVAALVRGTKARTGVLDPLGADLPAGPDLYFRLMRRLARALAACLSGARGVE